MYVGSKKITYKQIHWTINDFGLENGDKIYFRIDENNAQYSGIKKQVAIKIYEE